MEVAHFLSSPLLSSFLPSHSFIYRPHNSFHKEEYQALKELTDCSSKNTEPKKQGEKQHVITRNTVWNCFKQFCSLKKKECPYFQRQECALIPDPSREPSPGSVQQVLDTAGRRKHTAPFLQRPACHFLPVTSQDHQVKVAREKKPVLYLGSNFLHCPRVKGKGIETER